MRRPVVIAIVVATLIKLFIAWFTVGTSDVATWKTFADNAARCGSCVYHLPGPYGDPFNHPPFIILFLKLIAAAVPFAFWLRLPGIVADMGTVLIASRLLPSGSKCLLFLLAVNPVSILISGFHGNTDPVMTFLIVASVYAASRDRWAYAGLLFGMALNIKIVPLMLLPGFVFFPTRYKRSLRFLLAALAIVVFASLPQLDQIHAIVANVLGYKGLYVNWGLAHYFNLSGRVRLHFLAAPMRWAIMIGAVLLAWRLRRDGKSLFEICGAVIFLFYVLTPTIGLQYFAWGIPFAIALGLGRASLYYGIAAALIALQYHRWSHGLWYFADSHSVLRVTAETEFLSFALWVACGFLFWSFLAESKGRLEQSVP